MPLALKVAVFVALVTFLLQAGLATPVAALRACARRTGDLVRAVLIMVVLGPLVACLLAALFMLGPESTTALVLLSLAGVVPLASRGAGTAKSDVPFAMLITATLAVCVAFTAAPTARWLLGYDETLQVPAGSLILQVVLLQVVPIATGMLIRAKSAHAQALERALRIVNQLILLAVLAAVMFVLPRYGAVRHLGWIGALAAADFAICMAMMSYLLVGPELEDRRTLAAIANMPNFMLAIVIATNTGADSSLVLTIVGVFVVRFFVGAVIQRLLARRPDHAQGFA